MRKNGKAQSNRFWRRKISTQVTKRKWNKELGFLLLTSLSRRNLLRPKANNLGARRAVMKVRKKRKEKGLTAKMTSGHPSSTNIQKMNIITSRVSNNKISIFVFFTDKTNR